MNIDEKINQHKHYSIRNIIRDAMDTQLGYVKAAQVHHYFNEAFNIKHNYNLGYPVKNIEPLPQDEYEGLRTYTLARFVSKVYKVK